MSNSSVYPTPINAFKQSKRSVLSVIVDNEPGILARIVGLFSGRGYNIEALNVTVVDVENNLSRITIETLGEERVGETGTGYVRQRETVRRSTQRSEKIHSRLGETRDEID